MFSTQQGKTYLAARLLDEAIARRGDTTRMVILIDKKHPWKVIRRIIPGQVVTDSGELETDDGA